MRLIKKLIIGILIFIIIICAALFSFSWLYGDFIAQTVIKKLNNNLQTQITVEKVKFSIFSKFPNATIRLSKVTAKNKKSFFTLKKEVNISDTLFYADNIYLNLNLKNLFFKQYIINEFELNYSNLNIYFNEFDDNNFSIFNTSADSSQNSYLQLHKIKINNCNINYLDLKSGNKFNSTIDESLISGINKNEELKLKIISDLTLNHINTKNFNYRTRTKLTLNTSCEFNNDTIIINVGSISVNDNNLILFGKYYPGYIDLSASSDKMNFKHLTKILPSNLIEKITFEGIGKINLIIKGKYNKNMNPNLYLSLKSNKITINYKPTKNALNLNNINFDISIKKSVLNLNLKECIANFLNSNINISAFANYNDSLKYTCKLNGLINIADFKSLTLPKEILDLSGKINTQLSINGYCNKTDSSIQRILEKSNISGDVSFNNILFKHLYNNYSFNDLNGHIHISDYITSKDIEILYKNNSLKGSIAIPYLSVINQTFNYFNIACYSNNLNIDSLISSNNNTTSALFDANSLNGKIRLTANKMLYQNLVLQNLKSNITFSKNGIHFENIDFSTLNGSIDAEASIIQNGYTQKYSLSCNLLSVDINQLLKSFNNFGQNTLKYSHLKGLFNGSVFMKFSIDSLLNISDKSIEVESNIEIKNGELIGFDPILELSKFIKIDDLKHIKFATLKNKIQIKNRNILIPSMDISSNALNLNLYGNHDFDNNFEYHIRLSLSEVLFNKFKTNASNKNANFNEKDGKAQLFLFYVIKGNFDNFKVSFDSRNAKEQFKNNLLNEKNLLKNIIKSEFSGLKNDSTFIHKTSEKIIIEQDELIETPYSNNKTVGKPIIQEKTTNKKNSKPIIEWKDE